MGRKTWTNREIEYVKINWCKMTDTQISNSIDKSRSAISAFRKRQGWLKERPANHFTQSEDKFLTDNYQQMWDEELAKTLNRSVASIVARRFKIGLKRKAQRNKGNFKKGHTPWNKGIKGLQPSPSKSQFKKGYKPHNTLKIGEEVLRSPDKIGNRYYYIKTSNGLIAKQRYVWEQANGTIPDGKIIVFKNRDTTDCRIENLMCITRGEHARRNQRNGQKRQPKGSFLDLVLMAKI